MGQLIRSPRRAGRLNVTIPHRGARRANSPFTPPGARGLPILLSLVALLLLTWLPPRQASAAPVDQEDPASELSPAGATAPPSGAEVSPPPQAPPAVIDGDGDTTDDTAAAKAPATVPPATPAPPAVPDGARIGEIRVVTKGIFDPSEPGENRRVFRLADRLHRTTRPGVVERQLLFRPGDPYSPAALAESERLLRANRYLYDAEIRPVLPANAEGDRVDVEVVTRDVWTLRPGFSVSRAGGKNETKFSLEDSNFLGTGKDLTLWRISNVDRDQTLLRYRDPHLLGSRAQVEVSWADYSDGGARRFELERPFFAFDARWAAGLKAWRYERIDPLYDRGLVFDRFEHRRDWLEVYGGVSAGRVEGKARRIEMGVTLERNRFDFAPGGDSDSFVPPDRTLAYPWIGYQYVEDGFIAERDLDRLQRTEDLNLGRQLQARLGWSTRSFGADDDRLVFASDFAAGWRPGRRQLLLASAQAGSRWGDGGVENLLVAGRARYYVREGQGGRAGRLLGGERVFYVALEAALARRLDPELQLLLGGDSGLRGYPLRYQQGDRRWLATVEQRFFGDKEYFHLARLGAALFFDAGRAWFAREGALSEEVLRDVGVGLRIGSSRSADGAVVHLDLAYPLDGDPSIEKVQWLVLTTDRF
jgi:surface antigen-like variable number repeat protein